VNGPAGPAGTPGGVGVAARSGDSYHYGGIGSKRMAVDCVFFGPLREAVGTKTVTVDPDAGALRGLLEELEARYPALEGRVREGDDLAPEVVVTINGRHAQHEDGLATTLSDGDIVRLTTAIYGG